MAKGLAFFVKFWGEKGLVRRRTERGGNFGPTFLKGKKRRGMSGTVGGKKGKSDSSQLLVLLRQPIRKKKKIPGVRLAASRVRGDQFVPAC